MLDSDYIGYRSMNSDQLRKEVLLVQDSLYRDKKERLDYIYRELALRPSRGD